MAAKYMQYFFNAHEDAVKVHVAIEKRKFHPGSLIHEIPVQINDKMSKDK